MDLVLKKLQKLTRDALVIAAYAIIEQFINTKTPSHLTISINQAHLKKTQMNKLLHTSKGK